MFQCYNQKRRSYSAAFLSGRSCGVATATVPWFMAALRDEHLIVISSGERNETFRMIAARRSPGGVGGNVRDRRGRRTARIHLVAGRAAPRSVKPGHEINRRHRGPVMVAGTPQRNTLEENSVGRPEGRLGTSWLFRFQDRRRLGFRSLPSLSVSLRSNAKTFCSQHHRRIGVFEIFKAGRMPIAN